MARLEELERKFAENPRRYFAPLANEYRKAGDAEKAAELCRSQLPDVPGHISGHIVLGQALFDSGDFPGSRAALETALALDPENIVALRYLGDIARNIGDTAEAERWYSRTLEADPYNEAATQGLEALRDRDFATTATEKTVEPAPEPPVPSGEDDSEQTARAASRAEAIEAGDSPPIASEPAEDVEVATETSAPAALAEGFEPTARAVEPVPAEVPEPASETVAELEPTIGEPEVTVPEPEPVTEPKPAEPTPALADDVQVEDVAASAEFAGDLAISAASEPTEEGAEDAQAESAEPPPAEVTAADAEAPQVVADEITPAEAVPAERFDVEAHESVEASAAVDAEAAAAGEATQGEERVMESGALEAGAGDEAMQAEERVMESAAPFVTETMADLYLEQGYPHEALELLLQLAEQRPEDERLHEKVAHIESVIAARRDAVVAAARAERAEMAHAVDVDADAHPVAPQESAAAAVPEAVAEREPPDAPFDAAVAEVDSSAFADNRDPTAFEIQPFLPAEEEAPTTVRDMFARMDRARPRPPSLVTPRPISRLRSDFVPMPDSGGVADDSADDPFAFPDTLQPEQRVARVSGPHPTFNPSTADIDDFEAWLRGLKGP